MKTTIQLSIHQLKNLIEVAEEAKKKDDSLSSTIEIVLIRHTDYLTGTDKVEYKLISSYQDANGQFLGTN
jgi:hypothetical protein